ncbi:MAG TPA: hypothetical protein VJH37_00360 [Candidatus Nanoarchaeia archaeon]|nr:hypothetical protein [Candidatus Nanoarchaeia archaeon]
MRPEHVRIQQAECVFSEKNLLHAQLDVISLIKRYESFKAFRAEELLLKIALKSKIAEAKDSLALFEKLLPKPAIVPKTVKHESHEYSHHEAAHKKKQTLETEVEEIRRKLASLQ